MKIQILLFSVLFFLLSISASLFAQKKKKDAPPVRAKIKAFVPKSDLLYKSEIVWGLNMNTIGGLLGGVYFKKAYALSKEQYYHFSLGITYVKHPKELKNTNRRTGGIYTLYKRNYLFAVRPQIGREILLFQKARKQGIQVNAIFSAGPTLGIVAPYLVEFQNDQNSKIDVVQLDWYLNQNLNADQILGSGYISESLSRAKITPGISVKAALSFEMGTFKTSVSGFEAGFMIDAYTKEIEILQGANNRSVFSSIFFIFYYGTRK